MERRNFIKLFPLGMAAFATTAQGQENKEEFVKARQITIQGDDGNYSVLAVKSDSTQYRDVLFTGSNFNLGTTASTNKLVISNHNKERARIDCTNISFK